MNFINDTFKKIKGYTTYISINQTLKKKYEHKLSVKREKMKDLMRHNERRSRHDKSQNEYFDNMSP